ncbi:MAG: transcription termination/antitermination protein NusA [Verrucomicrobia bacterium]|nr:transcription termination/antitermination protein NusA [Verrucomicrobiota bacterium]
MNADLLSVLEYWVREKGIPMDKLISAVQEALTTAAKKAIGPARELRCEMNPKNGDIKAFAKLIVVDRVLSKHDQVSLAEARRIRPDAQLGDEVEVEVTPADFGRIASTYAKQSLLQHIRRAEKALIFAEFKDRVGDIVHGLVRRFEKSDVTIDLGRYDALLPNRERVPTEEYQIGERIRCFVKEVTETGPHGPEIILSRADPKFVIKLFQLEVSEVNDGTITIKAIAREPGFRTKLAVWTRDEKVDPVGACVGLRGQRVKNIVRELNNEKVDIIRWDQDITVLLTNALAPAKVKSFDIDESHRRARVIVNPDQLSLAIGKRGQNARLTSKLTGWQVDIEAEQVAVEGFEGKLAQAVQALADIPGITREQADALVHHGWTSLEALLQADAADLSEIAEIGPAAEAVFQAARDEAARRTIKIGDSPVA